jgi:hypothetical protein
MEVCFVPVLGLNIEGHVDTLNKLKIGNNMTCPKGHKKIICVEYNYGDPFRYDGVSEIMCKTCKKRYGRWTEKVLKKGEQEPPYGEPRNVTSKTRIYNL